MRLTRLLALAVAATVAVPLAGTSGAHTGHAADTKNGTQSGPVRSVAKQPGTAIRAEDGAAVAIGAIEKAMATVH